VANIDPEDLIGRWRGFGPIGPLYQIIGIDQERTTATEVWMLIHVLDSGEETGYRLSHILEDPIEA
jgi:hypothetical protein